MDTERPEVWVYVRCGLGDFLTYLTRVPALQEKYPGHAISFFVGGYGQAPQFMKEVGDVCPELLRTEIRWPEKRDPNVVEVLNWVPDDIPLAYPMQIPHPVVVPEEIEKKLEGVDIPWDRVLCMQTATTEGNERGYEAYRCWGERNWTYLSMKFIEEGWVVVWVGSSRDAEFVKAPKDVIDVRGDLTVLETIALLQHSFGCIGINSWVWEVSAYAGLPTVCIYLNDHHFVRLHVPQDSEKFSEHCLIVKDDKDWSQMYSLVNDFFVDWLEKQLPTLVGGDDAVGIDGPGVGDSL